MGKCAGRQRVASQGAIARIGIIHVQVRQGANPVLDAAAKQGTCKGQILKLGIHRLWPRYVEQI